MMNFYVVYDSFYEEYQQPFVMKNDNVALFEFDIFKNSLREKAKDDKEKAQIDKRYYLCKFPGIQYGNGTGNIHLEEKSIVPAVLTASEDEEE